MIHIINRADFRNAGDFLCGKATEDSFKNYEIIRHDIDDVQWNYIKKDDTVVLGASGMLNVTETFNKNIIRLLDNHSVIGYGIGFNKTVGQKIATDIFPHLKKFKYLGVRDYDHPSGASYLPCPTARLIQPGNKKILRSVGVVHHRDYKVPNVEQFPAITNAQPYWEIFDFIETSETIITSSYHVAFWSQLFGKKVLLGNLFSEKFNLFRHPIPIWDGDILKAKSVPNPEEFREECLKLLNEFDKNVMDKISKSDNINTVEGRIANLNWRVYTLEKRLGM